MAQSRPEPMNATSHHAKVKVSMTLGNSVFVAGGFISGKMEMECKADKGLGIGVMMVELFAIQELTSRDHSATSTFLHSRRLFQGPGLPPSNAVQPHPVPGEPLLPQNYYQARRGQSTFLFRFPIPSSSPSSINFGGDLARVRYELRASVGVCWKGEKRLVTDKTNVQVVECFDEDLNRPEPEGVVVAENGKIWAQGKIVGGVIVAGETACVELQVKNHSTKKNSGLVITLTRTLVLSGVSESEKSPLQISDTLVTVPFRGPEYIIPPGAEGVASLVFDVPQHACGVRGGLLQGDQSASKPTHSIFEVRCVVGITMNMGFGTKDIELDIPVTIVHPLALPELPPPPPQQYNNYSSTTPPLMGYQPPYADPRFNGYAAHPHPMSPPIPTAYVDPQQTHVWLPSPSATPHPYQYYTPPIPGQHPYYFPPPPGTPVYQPLPLNLARPLSAGGLPRPLSAGGQHTLGVPGQPPLSEEPEEGKGERASRIAQNLRQSTRNRSASPLSHRYPVAAPPPPLGASAASNPIPIPQTMRNVAPISTNNLSVSPAAGSGGDVISPRPVLSPKQSFADYNTMQKPKSERVEELERMADAVARQTSNLSGDIPKSTLAAGAVAATAAAGATLSAEKKEKREKREKKEKKEASTKRSKKGKERAAAAAAALAAGDPDLNLNKTLPGPPVPTGKMAPSAVARTRVDTYFDLPGGSSSPNELLTPKPADLLGEASDVPPTPTLTATKRPPGPGLLTSESGLDALERRLLYEVGTRKMEKEGRVDVRSVMALPMDIPPKKKGTGEDSHDDSAISSLTLAGGLREPDQEERDRDSDERTQGPKKSSSGRTERGGDGERRSGRKEREKEKEGGEPRKMRKAAKGRVAAWLGAIDPEIPPPDVEVPPTPSPDLDLDKVAPAAVEEEEPAATTPTVPNPRSSGFVPVKTFKRDPFQRIPGTSGFRHPTEEARHVADIWSASSPVLKDKSPALAKVTAPLRTPQSVHTDRNISPPSSPFKAGAAVNGWNAPAAPAKKVVNPSPRLPAFPPRMDPEVKYDVRSARGGRGGKVTAVASIWASGATSEQPPKNATPAKPASAAELLRTKAVVGGATSEQQPKNAIPAKPATAAEFLRSKAGSGGATSEQQPKNATPAKPTSAADFLRSKPVLGRSTPKSPLAADKSTAGRTPPAAAADVVPEREKERRPRPPPAIKSASLPAMISSSHATPTLSSTASLARPSVPANKPRVPPKLPPTIAETASGVVAGLKGRVQTPTSSVPTKITPAAPSPAAATSAKAGDLAFGQARLRDLIKKYQGQTAT